MPAAQRATIRELVPLLFVADIQRSLAFYRDRLGFAVMANWELAGKLAWCRLARRVGPDARASRGRGWPRRGRGHGVAFYFICDDADAMHAELLERGLRLEPPQLAHYGMKQVFVPDPDGYSLCFESPTAA